ncbi:hypothetical protein CSOJ01_04981 [Colletotrichum sojae]|uniref:Uncharacterized protein n=1 Tax=Colletotrichum sojae TaxID=2175907 RepID=A0A8H6JHL5_9PEZI|nr:hypothetical protein CSOJ01_04981 [Colletotrichum sojae]
MCVVCRRAARADGWTPRIHGEYEGEEEEAQRPGTSIPRRWKTVVQPAPSHDGSPTFAAYEVLEATAETEAELRPVRPAFGCVVYDTTHTAHRTPVSWFLPERFMDSRYSRMIVTVNNFNADGDDDDDEAPSWERSLANPEGLPISMEADESRYGSCMMIRWLPQDKLWAEVRNPGYTAQKRVACGGLLPFEHAGAALAEATNEVAVFYLHHVGDGLLDRHLEKARSS